MALSFRQATDELLATYSHEELALALDSSVPSVRQARMDPSTKGHRSPPQGWERAVYRLALQRAERLRRLASRLEQSANKTGNS